MKRREFNKLLAGLPFIGTFVPKFVQASEESSIEYKAKDLAEQLIIQLLDRINNSKMLLLPHLTHGLGVWADDNAYYYGNIGVYTFLSVPLIYPYHTINEFGDYMETETDFGSSIYVPYQHFDIKVDTVKKPMNRKSSQKYWVEPVGASAKVVNNIEQSIINHAKYLWKHEVNMLWGPNTKLKLSLNP